MESARPAIRSSLALLFSLTMVCLAMDPAKGQGNNIPFSAVHVSNYVHEIQIATSYDYGDGTRIHPFYEFGASMRVDAYVSSVSMVAPDGQLYGLAREIEGNEIWFSYDRVMWQEADLSAFTSGAFDFRIVLKNGLELRTRVVYAQDDGMPITPVIQKPQLRYPVPGATIAPGATSIHFAPFGDGSSPHSTIGLELDVRKSGAGGFYVSLPANRLYHSPVILEPNTGYDLELTYNHAYRSVNADGIPVVMDKDAEVKTQFFTHQASHTVVGEVERILIDQTRAYGSGGMAGHYTFWADVRCTDRIQSLRMIDPWGRIADMSVVSDVDGYGFEYWQTAPTLDGLGGLTDGPYTFILTGQGYGPFATVVDFMQAQGTPIDPVTQKPVINYPGQNAMNVPTVLDIEMMPAADPNAIMRLEWESDTWLGLSGEVDSLSGFSRRYGPVTLSAGMPYALDLKLEHAYAGQNLHGIPTLVKKSAEVENRFHTSSFVDESRWADVGGDYWNTSFYQSVIPGWASADHTQVHILGKQMRIVPFQYGTSTRYVTLGDVVFDHVGWLQMVMNSQGRVEQIPWGTTPALSFHITREVANGQLGLDCILRKLQQLSRADVVGDYGVIRYEVATLGASLPESGYGKVSFRPDSFADLEITYSDQRTEKESHFWTLGGTVGVVSLNGRSLTAGLDGILSSAWENPGYYGVALLVKRSDKKVLDDLRGHWFVQQYFADMETGTPETRWGTMTVKAGGDYRMRLQTSKGAVEESLGRLNVTPQGEVHLSHNGVVLKGMLTDSNDIMVLAETGQYGNAGLWVITRKPRHYVELSDPALMMGVEEALQGEDVTLDALLELNRLVLPDRGITNLDGLEKARNLEYLDLRNNAISSLEPLAGLTKLKVLGLSSNGLFDISSLSALTHLEELSLEHNYVIEVQSLQGLTQLKRLNLSGNRINDIDSLASLSALEVAWLNGNRITSVKALTQLPRLVWVDLQHNSLSGNDCLDIRLIRSIVEGQNSGRLFVDTGLCAE